MPAIVPTDCRSSRTEARRGLKSASLCLLFAIVSLCGCAVYRPRPLDPPRLEAEYRRRELQNEGLRAFVEANSGGRPVSWPPATLDLPALTLIAFYYSPDLDVARARVAGAEASIVAAGARVNPSLALEGGYNTNPESRPVYSFLPGFTIETAGKRGLRWVHAQKRAETARLELAEEGWRLRSRVRNALLRYVSARQKLELLQTEDAIRAEIVDMFDKRLAAGEAARPELDVFRVDRITTQAALQGAVGEVAHSFAELAATTGLPASALEGLSLEWPNLEKLPGEEALSLRGVERAGLLHRADVRRGLAEYAAAEAAVQLEYARRYPDLHLIPAYEFEEGFARYMLNPALGPLPVFHRNRGPIAVAEAQRAQAAAQFTTLQAQVIGEMERAVARYRAALAAWKEANLRLAAVQRDREEAARRALAAGEGDRLSLATARLQTVTAARVRLDALLRVQTALGALEDAVQQPLEQGLAMPEVTPAGPRPRRNP